MDHSKKLAEARGIHLVLVSFPIVWWYSAWNISVRPYKFFNFSYVNLTVNLTVTVTVRVGIATCTPACTEVASDTGSTGSRGPTTCVHGQLHRHQEIIERGLRPVLSHPYSSHQIATVNALTEANNALVKCRDTLKWIYGKHDDLYPNQLLRNAILLSWPPPPSLFRSPLPFFFFFFSFSFSFPPPSPPLLLPPTPLFSILPLI